MKRLTKKQMKSAEEEAKKEEKNADSPKEEDQRPPQFFELCYKYDVRRELGHGSYGTVYKVKHKVTNTKFAVKRILPTMHGNYILMEVLFLQLLKGKSHIIELMEGVRDKTQISLIFKYVKATSFYLLLEEFTMKDVREYMFQLLTAISIIAELGIVHRDIKPSNFLYSTKEKAGYLIDFGLSEIEIDTNNRIAVSSTENNDIIKRIFKTQMAIGAKNRTGTKGYLAPETIFKAKFQTRAVDVWAAGVMMLSLLAKRHPILSLHAGDSIKGFSLQNLIPLIYIFGTRKIKQVAFHFDTGIIFPACDELPKEQVDWRVFCQKRGSEVDDTAIDLLEKMLQLFPEKRITAAEALKHPFFRDHHQFSLIYEIFQ